MVINSYSECEEELDHLSLIVNFLLANGHVCVVLDRNHELEASESSYDDCPIRS